MLAMGRALMGRPRLLMLDEPSLGLAPLIVRDIFEIIVGLKATGVSILLVEQNARAALQVADHAYVMELGEITAEGPASNSPPIRASSRAIWGWVGSLPLPAQRQPRHALHRRGERAGVRGSRNSDVGVRCCPLPSPSPASGEGDWRSPPQLEPLEAVQGLLDLPLALPACAVANPGPLLHSELARSRGRS